MRRLQIPSWVWWAGGGLVAAAAFAALSSKLSTPPGTSEGDEGDAQLDLQGLALEIWTLGKKPGVYCGLPTIPLGSSEWGFAVVQQPAGQKCWGWTPPGTLDAAREHGRSLIADVELRRVTTAKPEAGWTGSELGYAEQLAALVGGVTSHGFVLKELREVMKILAAADLVAYPQVYATKNTKDPRKFLRTCVSMYRDVGFKTVVPLIGVVAGQDFVLQWLQECEALKCQAALWSLQRLQQMNVKCDAWV
jgi:hypothetical protein